MIYDDGDEYICFENSILLRRRGIIHEVTTAHPPGLNGREEGLIRSFRDVASLLILGIPNQKHDLLN